MVDREARYIKRNEITEYGFTTKQDLGEAVDELTTRIHKIIEDKLSSVYDNFIPLQEAVKANKVQIDLQDAEVQQLKAENYNLKTQLEDLESKFNEFQASYSVPVIASSPSIVKTVEELEERIEERTNRQLRQTLVIKGIREQKNETWDDTKHILAKTISNNLRDVSISTAEDMLNRVHRSKPTKNVNKIHQRDIYANLFSWQDCDEIVHAFRKLNARQQTNIKIDFKYGPRTTYRRNEALKVRRKLLEEGSISRGYVAYPARLMVKTQGDGAKTPYRMHSNFSKVEVKFYESDAKSAILAVDLDNHDGAAST